MIEIKSNRLVALLFDSIKAGLYFILLIYALKIIYNYLNEYISYLIENGLEADLSSILFISSFVEPLFEHFFIDLLLVLAFVLIFQLRNKFVFDNGYIYVSQGFLLIKKRTIPYNNIREIDYNKTLFNIGSITIKLYEEKKPLIMSCITKVEETLDMIKKEIEFDNNEKRVFKQVQEVGSGHRPVKHKN